MAVEVVDAVSAEVVCRMVEVAHPEKIILFGSAPAMSEAPIATWTCWR